MYTKTQSIAPSNSEKNSPFTTFAVVFAAASTPLPTAWGSISMVFLLIAFLLQAFKRKTWSNIADSSLSWASIGILVALGIGVFYSNTGVGPASEFWTKYLKLLVVPLIIGIAPNHRTKCIAINAALTAVTISVMVSYGRYFGLLHPFSDPNQAYIGFQNRITFGLYTSIASYVFAHRALRQKQRFWKIGYTTLFLITALNTLAINNGRTGYAIFFALTVLFLYRNIRPGQRLISAMFAILAIIAILFVSPLSRERLERSISNAETLGQSSQDNQSSTVIRWQFLINSLNIIRSAPLLGHGTGSFEAEYAKQIAGTHQIGSSNPHNDYLLILAQLGIFGLFFEFGLIAAIYENTKKVRGDTQDLAYALLVAFILYSALNSTLLNAGEGRFFLILLALTLSAAPNNKPDRVE